jgi:predicted helicase
LSEIEKDDKAGRAMLICKPQELAKRMAQIAHMIRNIIIDNFDKKLASDNLRELYITFQEVLLLNLKVSEFADMFAQIMVYGLFAARSNHRHNRPFFRSDVASEIPPTSPFLCRLFGIIAEPDVDDEPFVGFVDELAQILALTDMEAVLADFGKHTRQEDPIVHFYEIFLAQYDPKLRQLRGVYYTPEPVVSYMVRSVDYLLREHFDCPDGLADTATVSYSCMDKDGEERIQKVPHVVILDPATGTGTFLSQVIAHVRERYRQMGNAEMWSGYVREYLLPRLFGFELLMAPYAIAHLKLGMQMAALDLPEPERAMWGYNFSTDECLGIYLTNTLDEVVKRSQILFGRSISDEANEGVRAKQSPVMVMLGNPPYSGHSANRGEWMNDLLRGQDSQTGQKTANYFEVDGQPLGEHNPKWLNDDYVKFMRFAQWCIEKTGHGILAFITNHSYLDNPTFRGMRQSLIQAFDDIYILDLHGNSKKREYSPDGTKDENVFNIQQGVAIGIFVKWQQKTSLASMANIYHAHLWGRRTVYEEVGEEQKLVGGKYYWLSEHDVSSTQWEVLHPQSPYYLFRPQDRLLSREYESGWTLTKIMPELSLGCLTKRDNLVISQNKDELRSRILHFIDPSKTDREAVDEFGLALADHDMWNVSVARRSIQPNDIDSFIRSEAFRPFDRRYIFYHEKFVARLNRRVMRHLDQSNLALVSVRQLAALPFEHVWVTEELSDQHLISVRTKEGGVVLPLYLYLYPDPDPDPDAMAPFDTGSRRSNLSPAFIKDFSTKLRMDFIPDGKGDLQPSKGAQQTFGPEDVFDYMYAVFHSPAYRERYAEFLKIDFPRLPLTSNVNLFCELCKLGERLVELHLMKKFGGITTQYPVSGSDVIEKIAYTSCANAPERGQVWINKTQYIEGVPPDVWKFRVGGHQVCQKWLKDRKGCKLQFHDIQHYQHIVAILAETIRLMDEIDRVIDEHEGWPIQ